MPIAETFQLVSVRTFELSRTQASEKTMRRQEEDPKEVNAMINGVSKTFTMNRITFAFLSIMRSLNKN
jgi:hypothetical protein